ncbi:MAG: sugar phosphate isomerase/epimerase, partial [Flavisolibacter sp.]|nr:sugar phosphate isomerase/epimerase [Flavisolibacter sp.]
MTTRRKFIQQSGTLAVGGLLLPRLIRAGSFFGEKAAWPIGLQLYTLGNLMTTDTESTLKKLAAIGYKELESASSQKGNYYGYKPKEFATLLKSMGMNWRSAHVGGAPFTMENLMKMAKTAQDSARIQGMAERFKNMPKTLNLKENYQQLAD